VSDDLSLVPYDGTAAALVVGWCAESPFSREWVPAAASDPDAVLAGWHTDPDITGHLLLRDGHPVAYGELWVEADDDEAELAHLVVDPALRRQGLGQALAVRLIAAARAQGLAHVFLRVHPDNHVAIGTYATVGFAPVTAEEEAAFNAGQPAAYRWMRLLEPT
jgi:ribosomal protein S18 acetylase RimI-like enzyme